jgi:hypothetical protein
MRWIRPRSVPLLLSLLLAVGGCAAGVPGGPAPSSSGSTILSGEQLGGGATLLDALGGRVPTLQITRSRDGGCPHVTVRGARSLTARSSAAVYVDGTLMGDTCILDQIPTREVDRVEIHSAGSTNLPLGYRSSPFGLIAVYRVRNVRR